MCSAFIRDTASLSNVKSDGGRHAIWIPGLHKDAHTCVYMHMHHYTPRYSSPCMNTCANARTPTTHPTYNLFVEGTPGQVREKPDMLVWWRKPPILVWMLRHQGVERQATGCKQLMTKHPYFYIYAWLSFDDTVVLDNVCLCPFMWTYRLLAL